MKLKIINKSKHSLPNYKHIGDSGMDVIANLENSVVLKPLQRALIPTGLYVELPVGYEIQVRPRSGLALKEGLTVLNTPGTVDSGYRGEIGVIMVNLSDETRTIIDGERIAQIVLAKVEKIEGWEEIIEFKDETDRGEGGYASTGMF